jgi:cytoskeletal protein CcmA (bactofilin family)
MPDETKQPQPEKLAVQGEAGAESATNETKQGADKGDAKPSPITSAFNNAITPRRASYRPSSRATFIGLTVVALIIAINIGVIAFVMRGQDTTQQVNKETVTLSSETLGKLGMTKTNVNNEGTELVVGPNAKFNGTVTMGSDVKIAGKLNLNNTLEAADVRVTRLQAQNLQIDQLNANGDGTISTLNLRKDLNVAGNTALQGTVTIAQLMTVNNSVNIVGSLAVGGTLSVRNFQASSLTSDTTLTIGGHVITRGNAPAVATGPGVGSSGTASISGNDASGTVAVNTGVGAAGGLLASVTFTRAYATTPHVIVTPVGNYVNVYINRTVNGFTISSAGALAPAGYAFDYIVMQ